MTGYGKLLDMREEFLTYGALYVQNKTNQCFRYNNLWSVIGAVRLEVKLENKKLRPKSEYCKHYGSGGQIRTNDRSGMNRML